MRGVLLLVCLSIAVLSMPGQTARKKAAAAKKPAAKTAPPAAPWVLWGGPNRDFQSPSTGLADQWPPAGPRRIWSRPLGQDGYSGMAVENGVLYTMYRRGTDEVTTALEAATGKTLWESTDSVQFRNANAPDVGPGPYAMPQVIGDRVYTSSANGHFLCLDKKTGQRVWAHDLYREFSGSPLEFGYSCHALPYKNSLIMLAGGSGSAIIAFDPNDGHVLWRKQRFKNAHSSPLLINVDGQDQVVALTAQDVFGFDPNNGELLWQHSHPTEYGLAISTPVWAPGNLLFISTAYNGGARVLQLSRSGAKTQVKELWRNQRLQVHFGSVIRNGDYVYFSSGHRGPVFLTGVELKTGKVVWQNRDFAKAQLLAADGKLILVDQDGTIALAVATPQEFRVLAKAPVLTAISWTPPTLAGTTLYVRDRRNIMALDVGK